MLKNECNSKVFTKHAYVFFLLILKVHLAELTYVHSFLMQVFSL